MKIPSVVQGIIELEDGKVFELDSVRGAMWLESVGSFRYVPVGDNKAYTARKEQSGYWYGCRKIAGTVRKKYIGKNSDVSTAKLEDIAEALEDSLPPVSRVKKVAQVAQVAQVAEVVEGVAEVAEVAQGRLATLESEVALLRQAVKALQEAMPGKSESGNFEELPKVTEVVEELQNELRNLRTENESLRQELETTKADYAALLESSKHVTARLREEVQQLRSQVDTQKTDWDELLADFENSEQLRDGYWHQVQILQSELDDATRTDRPEIQESVPAVADFPEAADLLNQVRAQQRKKTTISLADIEIILEILGGC